MGLEKINLDIEMDFMNLKFEIWNVIICERLFLAWFFHLNCYGTSMCGGKKILNYFPTPLKEKNP